jgi:NitT/TauT family transport system permease protein
MSETGPSDNEGWVHRAFARLAAWLRYSRLSLLFAIGLIALWQALVVGLDVPRYILPAPSEIYTQFWRNLPRIAYYTLVTAGESFVGFLVAVAIGVPLALVVAFSSALR